MPELIIVTRVTRHLAHSGTKRAHILRPAAIIVLAGALATVALAQIPASAYPVRRAAAMARIAGDVLIVPARASFLADDQLGFVQAADFQYLTGLDELVGAVLVLDGASSTSRLFVAPQNPLLTRGVIVPGAESARRLQLSAVEPVDALEPWLRQRFARPAATVYVAPTDARAAVPAPLPMAGSVIRWQSWLTSLGAG
jgi:hypothetical protein